MQNFDLRISDYDGQTLRVEVVESPAGNVAPVAVEAPRFSAADLAGRSHTALRDLAPMPAGTLAAQPDAALRTLAAEFTAQVMPDAIWQAWRESWAAAGAVGIRLRIRSADPKALGIPWELLYDAQRATFLAQDPRSPVVRYLEGPIPDTVRPVAGALRMLLTGASPADQVPLAVGRELTQLQSSLAAAQEAGQLVVKQIPALTPDTLDGALLSLRPHLFHFSGHGLWDERAGAGYLLLEGGDGSGVQLADATLAMLLRSRGVVLALLNGCKTALGGAGWTGLAQALVLAGVPAVVAMQMPVSDAAAIAFAETFYAALAHGYAPEQAVTLARQTVARQPQEVASPGAWLAPVLFLRTGSDRFWPPARPFAERVEADGTVVHQMKAVNVAESQTNDQRGATFNLGDRVINTGGAAYIGGDVTISGGEFVGGNRIGHKGGGSGPEVDAALTRLAAAVALQAATADLNRIHGQLRSLQQAIAQADDQRTADCIDALAELAPSAKEIMREALSRSPLDARLGPAARYVVRRLGGSLQ